MVFVRVWHSSHIHDHNCHTLTVLIIRYIKYHVCFTNHLSSFFSTKFIQSQCRWSAVGLLGLLHVLHTNSHLLSQGLEALYCGLIQGAFPAQDPCRLGAGQARHFLTGEDQAVRIVVSVNHPVVAIWLLWKAEEVEILKCVSVWIALYLSSSAAVFIPYDNGEA